MQFASNIHAKFVGQKKSTLGHDKSLMPTFSGSGTRTFDYIVSYNAHLLSNSTSVSLCFVDIFVYKKRVSDSTNLHKLWLSMISDILLNKKRVGVSKKKVGVSLFFSHCDRETAITLLELINWIERLKVLLGPEIGGLCMACESCPSYLLS